MPEVNLTAIALAVVDVGVSIHTALFCFIVIAILQTLFLSISLITRPKMEKVDSSTITLAVVLIGFAIFSTDRSLNFTTPTSITISKPCDAHSGAINLTDVLVGLKVDSTNGLVQKFTLTRIIRFTFARMLHFNFKNALCKASV